VNIRVAVAEDNYVVRAGIEKILEADPDIELVGSCGDLDSLDRLIAAASPHVVVTDIRMPPAQADEGLEIARRLRRAESAIGVVVLSQYAEPTYARALLEDGAAGRAYLLKDRVSHGSQLLRAVREVAEGGSMVDPEVVSGLMAARTRQSGSALAELTSRERDVLTLIAEGRSNQGIAQTLAVSQSAVEKHVNAIFSKLLLDAEGGAHRRVRAALLYLADTHSG
jgi:DNA-binding NarL/FixJ family response regulator